ncbi:MAG: acyl carrier protein [Sulfuricaulis sp.]
MSGNVTVATQLKEWVAARTGLGIHEINPNTILFGPGLLDSFSAMALSLYIEELLGRKITIREIEKFQKAKSIRGIIEAFFSEPSKTKC